VGRPLNRPQELTLPVQAGETALNAAKDESSRTPVAAAVCRSAFEALTAKMRDIKERYFYVSPLTAADLVGLGLKPYGSTHTASGTPTVQATVETFLVRRHEPCVKNDLRYRQRNRSRRQRLPDMVWRNRAGRKPASDAGEFDFGDLGKTAWFVVQNENFDRRSSRRTGSYGAYFYGEQPSLPVRCVPSYLGRQFGCGLTRIRCKTLCQQYR
jgi:hypothetical protein